MAIIVDKDKKRSSIALACKDLVVNSSFKDITITKIAKEAGIAKGSFYDYFKNKEDLIFEIVNILMQKYNKKTEAKLKEAKDAKEKLKIFASFYYSQEDSELRGLYKEFVAISLTSANKEMIEFQSKIFKLYRDWLEEIIKEAIKHKELPDSALSLVDVFFATVKGLFITYEVTDVIDDLKEAIESYIDTIFGVIK
jgi:AcrR family transcriptional regulator